MTKAENTLNLVIFATTSATTLGLFIERKLTNIPAEDRVFALSTIKIVMHLVAGKLDSIKEEMLESGEALPLNDEQRDTMNRLVADTRKITAQYETMKELKKHGGCDMKN